MFKLRTATFVVLLLTFSLFHDGVHAWEDSNFTVAQFGGSANDVPNSIESDSNGNIYVSGYFAGTTDFDPSLATESATSVGLGDAFIAKYSPSGSFIWARYFGGAEDDQVIASAIDGNNNLYLAGTYKSTVDFDYSLGTETSTASGSGTDIFVTKIASDGTRLWTKTFGSSTLNDSAVDIAVDSNGNMIVVGNYYGTVDFNPGAGTTSLSAGGSYNDIFVLKLNTNGEFVWVKSVANTQSNDEAQGVSLFPNGDVVVVGGFGANTIPADFDPGSATFTLSAGSTNHNIFIWKLTSNGEFGWAKNIGNSATADRAYSVGVDSNSNVYTTGTFQSSAAFSSVGDTLTATGYDGFLTKHDSSGVFQWVKQLAGSGNDYGRRIAVDSSSNVYISGHFSGSFDLDPGIGSSPVTAVGAPDTFITKISPSGNFLWGRAYGTSGNDYYIGSTIGQSGSLLNTGYLSAALQLTSGSNSLTLTPVGAVDALFFCLTSSGEFTCGMAEQPPSLSGDDQQRKAREERDRAVALARSEVSSMLSSGRTLTKDILISAGFNGATEKNIDLINAEISELAKKQNLDITLVARVVYKYEVLGKLAAGQTGTVFPEDLIKIGLIPADSKYKTSITLAIKKLPSSARSTYSAIQDAVSAEIARIQSRKDRLAVALARNSAKTT